MGDQSASSLPSVVYFDPAGKNLFEECGAIFPKDQKPGTLQSGNFQVENLRPGLQELYAKKNPYLFFVEEFRRGNNAISHERMLELAPICQDPETYLEGGKGSPCYWFEEKSGFPGWVCEAGAWTVGGLAAGEGIRRGIKYVRQRPGGGGDPPTDPPVDGSPPSPGPKSMDDDPSRQGVEGPEKASEPAPAPDDAPSSSGTASRELIFWGTAVVIAGVVAAVCLAEPTPAEEPVTVPTLLYSLSRFAGAAGF